ncbi:MAG TPA: hypothetical protein VJV78_01305 [Polyangiales bacterium]|nr:hypothetical protein [Polyangiales bacterium]
MIHFRLLTVLIFVCAACAEDETIVSVNVSSGDAVGNPKTLTISISQPGQQAVVKDIEPPTKATDAGPVIQPMFYERITLPDSWSDERATVQVDAKDASGKVYLTGKAMCPVVPQGAAAAFVDLGKMEMMKPDAGSGEDAGI